MILNKTSGEIDMRDTMYPSSAFHANNEDFNSPELGTVYGFVLSGHVELPDGNKARTGQYFCYWSKDGSLFKTVGEAVFFVRHGFKGQNTIGGPIEGSGRLCYIDSCSDSLLIYPPRMGDASLNVLYFPTGINQTYHIHPSIRFGVVASGRGISCVQRDGKEVEVALETGMMFCIEERELHRFRTDDSKMVVIAFHPDGDWGPTDHNHTMLNRTYVTK